MKKTTRKRKPQAPPQHVCSCEYNKYIRGMFDEAFEAHVEDSGKSEEYHEALNHSDHFKLMCEAAEDDNVNKCCILSDAVYVGYMAGLREAETRSLEKMCGF